MRVAVAVASALACCAAGCVNPQADPPRAAAPWAEVYQRATNQFAQADFFKPAETKTNELAFTLAPLILQEVTGANGPFFASDRFGTLGLTNGVAALDPSRPAIYWHADTVTLGGKVHARMTYFWFYGPGRTGTGLPSQGVRITLSSAGLPVVWEVLADAPGAELIFVSQSLEAAAAAQFGKPFPGRRYAIERSFEDAPNVVVARVIDDGPVAMGPIVYLSAGTRTVSTLICRCMPAQVKTLRTTTTYGLLPLQPGLANSLLPPVTARADAGPAFWPDEAPTGTRLERCLRLPAF